MSELQNNRGTDQAEPTPINRLYRELSELVDAIRAHPGFTSRLKSLLEEWSRSVAPSCPLCGETDIEKAAVLWDDSRFFCWDCWREVAKTVNSMRDPDISPAEGQMKSKSEKVICNECGSVVAERRADGTIIIRARHHGATHITIIPPAQTPRENSLAVASAEGNTMPSADQR